MLAYGATEEMLARANSFWATVDDAVANQRKFFLSSSRTRCCQAVVFSLPKRVLTILHLRMTQRVDDMRRQRRVQAAAIALKPEQDAACTSPVKSVRRRITQRAPQASRPLRAAACAAGGVDGSVRGRRCVGVALCCIGGCGPVGECSAIVVPAFGNK